MILPQLSSVLVETGFFPDGTDMGRVALNSGIDLLPAMLDAWHSTTLEEHGRRRRTAVRTHAQLASLSASGSKLTMGVPGRTAVGCQKWLGARLVWWPRGIPENNRTAFVSSRLGRRLDEKQTWFAFLRAVCSHTLANQSILVSASSTTTGRFLMRAADLFSVPALIFHVSDRDDLVSWRRKTLSRPVVAHRGVVEAYVSPEIDIGPKYIDEKVADIPARDRLVLAGSDRVFVAHLRPGGNLQRLVTARLSQGDWTPGSVMLAANHGAIPQKDMYDLMQQGAVAWLVPDLACQASSHNVWQAAEQGCAQAPTVNLPKFAKLAEVGESRQYLTHCTRRQNRNWPDEGEPSYIDALILGRNESRHSALAALLRIVRSKRLIASTNLIRGETPVVSLTAAPPGQIECMTKYQRHLARWDFEPYGICIHKEWLDERGARPVQYGDEALWTRLKRSSQPFFQLRGTRRDKSDILNGQWESEQEWRHVGDIDLSALPPAKALIFVPTTTEARMLHRVSRWPVVVASGYQVNRLLRR